ncbi:hypothetical protein IFM89_026445 [Coptis chinensis]|uniref:Uncharacterized protein n=1 Tax=Coptis chinensis TaxID=261450 RepID=A0A835GY59_9MAGN|nr:hypothetical protein IFM89_026445 [Coptis chinensis]
MHLAFEGVPMHLVLVKARAGVPPVGVAPIGEHKIGVVAPRGQGPNDEAWQKMVERINIEFLIRCSIALQCRRRVQRLCVKRAERSRKAEMAKDIVTDWTKKQSEQAFFQDDGDTYICTSLSNLDFDYMKLNDKKLKKEDIKDIIDSTLARHDESAVQRLWLRIPVDFAPISTIHVGAWITAKPSPSSIHVVNTRKRKYDNDDILLPNKFNIDSLPDGEMCTEGNDTEIVQGDQNVDESTKEPHVFNLPI